MALHTFNIKFLFISGKRVINAFCIFENTASLNKKFNNDITVLHGIRSISSGIVVGLHVFFVNNWIGTINYLDVEKVSVVGQRFRFFSYLLKECVPFQ